MLKEHERKAEDDSGNAETNPLSEQKHTNTEKTHDHLVSEDEWNEKKRDDPESAQKILRGAVTHRMRMTSFVAVSVLHIILVNGLDEYLHQDHIPCHYMNRHVQFQGLNVQYDVARGVLLFAPLYSPNLQIHHRL